jgi:outer membrane protein
MKRLLCAVLLAGAASTLAARVTLAQAVAGAWAISRGLESQELEEKAAAIAVASAQRRQRFAVAFGGGYRYTSDNVQVTAGDFPFPLGSDVPPGAVILSTPNGAIDLKLSLVQPVYTGGLLASAVRGETARGAAERELTRLKRVELAGRVKASYFSYQMYCRKRDSLSHFLAGLDLHLKKVEALWAEELARRTDLLETRAKVDETQLSLADLEQLIAAESVQFSSLCGFAAEEIETPPAATAGSFEQARAAFLAGHPLLRSLAERQRVVQAQRRSLAAAYLPQVSAFAEMHYGRPGQNYFLNEWTFYVQGGLSVTLPVFNWNQRGRDLELAGIAARKLDNQRADFIRETEKSLRQAYLSLASADRKLALLDGLVAGAAEEVRLKEQLYEESQIDHGDLLAAMAAAERYQSGRGELLAQMEMLKAGIDTLIGTCEEEG